MALGHTPQEQQHILQEDPALNEHVEVLYHLFQR